MPRRGSREALELKIAALEKDLAEARQETRPAPRDLIALGEPPEDTLEAEKYLLRANMINAREVMVDATLKTKERWKWILEISETVHKLVPKARIYEAESVIKQDRADIERRKSRGAELVPAPGGEPDASAAPAPKKKPPQKRKNRPRKEKAEPARRGDAPQLVPAPQKP